MTSNTNFNLVLNINTPQFFKESNTSKRSLDEAFVTVASKKRKLSHPAGKAIRPSSKLNKNKKLKINSFLNSQKQLKKNEVNTSHQNSVQKTKDKAKVTFNSQVEVFSESQESIHRNSEQEKSSAKLGIKKPANGQKITKTNKEISQVGPGLRKSSVKSVVSSLFKKNPEIPEIPAIENGEQKSGNSKIFSNSTFDSLDISPKLIDTVNKLGCSTMTVVQELSIPAILDGKDALIKSQTGSGKTLAYAIPIVHKLMMVEPKINRRQGLFALVIVPTRELAVQSYHCFENLCKKKSEKARIRKGINILIATPGRLMDHIDNTNSLELDKLQYLILDEADRMLDMGYEQNIKGIIYALNKVENPVPRQTVMLSATLTNAVEKLAGITLKSPKTIDVTSDLLNIDDCSAFNDEYLVTPENLKHHFMLVPMKVRLVSLAAFIIEKCKFSNEKKILVFMTTQDMVDYHTSLFADVLSKLGKKKSDPLERRALKVLSGESDDEEDEEDFDEDPEDEIHFMKLHGSMSQP
ncbi:putative ATP-dependent RNA helicase DDX31, partial [Armadillidium nasatum]